MTSDPDPRPPRHDFRVLTRRKGGYTGEIYDVQLQSANTGAILSAWTFSDQQQAQDFEAEVDADLDALEGDEFRRKYSVTSAS